MDFWEEFFSFDELSEIKKQNNPLTIIRQIIVHLLGLF